MSKKIILWMSVLCFLEVGAQDVVDRVKKELAEEVTTHPMTRPLIYFNQDKYAPGDTAYFRLYLLSERRDIEGMRVLLNFELIDENGRLAVNQYVPCDPAGAANQLVLPSTLNPGMYKLMIYSDRYTRHSGYQTDFIVTGEFQTNPTNPAAMTAEFFPEGGRIVAGVLNRLVVRLKGDPVGEVALRSRQSKISSFTVNKRGYGTVLFNPAAGEEFTIEATGSDARLKSFKVPDAAQRGLTLRAYPGPKKTIVIDISGTEEFRDKKVYLVLLSHREIVYQREVTLSSEAKTQILGSAEFLPEGYTHLYVLDDQGKTLSHRPAFRKPVQSLRIDMSGIPGQAYQRQTITGTLRLSDAEGNPVPGAFCISVFNGRAHKNNIPDPVPSLVLNPEPLEVDLSQSEHEINMELISRFPVDKSLFTTFDQTPARMNLTLAGQVTARNSQNEVDSTMLFPEKSTMLIFLHKDLIQYETPIDRNGYFKFSKLYDFFGTDLAYFKVNIPSGSPRNLRVQWLTDSTKRPDPSFDQTLTTTQLADDYSTRRKQTVEINQSYSFFRTQDNQVNPTKNFNAYLEDEFQGADITINPRDYVSFGSLDEMILEIIPSLQFRKNNRDSSMRVNLTSRTPFDQQRFSSTNPLLIVDGYMTPSMGFAMRLDPASIVSIKIINDIGKLNRLGNLARDGIVFIQTAKPEKNRALLESQLLKVNGLSPTLKLPKSFPAEARLPDLRSNLLWNPSIHSEEQGIASFEFRTSDDVGDFVVRVIGNAADGRLIIAEFPLPVVFNK